MNVPSELQYSSDHEWVRSDGATVRVGITDYAQDSLGDVVFVELPEVGSSIDAGATFGEVESTKSVSDLYSPVTGTITEVNTALEDTPELLNSDPYGEGWVCVIELAAGAGVDGLLDATAYGELIAD